MAAGSLALRIARLGCLRLAITLGLAVAELACSEGPTPPPLAIALNTVAPDTLVEGRSATLNGSGFSSTAAENLVTIGGLPATVTSATTTRLTVSVPQICLPEREVDVSVTVGTVTSNAVTTPLRPASFLSLAVGEQVIIQDPAQFCLHFPPSAAGGDAYLIGVGSAAEVPDEVVSFTITGVAAESPAAVLTSIPPQALPAATQKPPVGWMPPEPTHDERSDLRRELELRHWERTLFHGALGRLAQWATAEPRSAAVPAVGDTIRFKVPAGSETVSDCDSFVTVATTVRVVGDAGIWVTDAANPEQDALTLAEIQGLSDTFDLAIYPVDTTYFGAPTDIDLNQRVYVVMTIEVNRQGTASIVFDGDLHYDRAFCTQSNGGEIIYMSVPDPGNVTGAGARPKSAVLYGTPYVMAHQLTHVIQLSRKFTGTYLFMMNQWEMEGQALLGEEVVGHHVLGNGTGRDLGASVAFGADGSRWYRRAFEHLATYFGWLPPASTTKATNAPELCTLFGERGLDTTCDDRFAFQGASWALFRYLSDRFGPTYPGGEAGLHRDYIGLTNQLYGSESLELLLGVSFDTLFAQWAAALYLDGRVVSDGPLAMSSWNLLDVFNAFESDAYRLIPTERTFASFADARAVRGGSTAYTRLSAAGPHSAFAIRVRDPADAVLNQGMREQLWVVRLH